MFSVVTYHVVRRVRRFRGTYHLHIQGLRVSQASNQQKQAAYTSTLKREAICSSETSGFLRTTVYYRPDNRSLHNHYRVKREGLQFPHRGMDAVHNSNHTHDREFLSISDLNIIWKLALSEASDKNTNKLVKVHSAHLTGAVGRTNRE
jgi:hypothetical protein